MIKKYLQNNLLSFLLVVIFVSFFILTIGLAWTEPNAAPPGGNIAAPLNVGDTGQVKSGGLTLNWKGGQYGLIVAAGNVGIGTTNPGAKLDVRGVIGTDSVFGFSNVQQTASPYGVYISAPAGQSMGLFTNSVERIRIDSGGNVGIGTTNPGYRLDIAGDVRWTGTLQGGSVPWARLTGFPSGCPSGQFVTAIGGTLTCATPGVSGGGGYWAASGNNIYNTNPDNVGIGTQTPGARLDVAGRFLLSRLESPGYGGASAGVAIIGTPNSGGGLLFRPAGLDNNSGEVLFKSGIAFFRDKVGIGTTNPDHKLVVNGNTRILGDSNSKYSLYMVNMGDGNQKGWFGHASWIGGITIYEDDGGTSINLKNGKVGIGTTNPGQKLDVFGGYIRSDTGFCIGGSCISKWSDVGGGGGARVSNLYTCSKSYGTSRVSCPIGSHSFCFLAGVDTTEDDSNDYDGCVVLAPSESTTGLKNTSSGSPETITNSSGSGWSIEISSHQQDEYRCWARCIDY
jgi:hypothetical protein